MMKHVMKLVALALLTIAQVSDAGVIVSLTATDSNGQPVTGGVDVGETIVVDVYLAVDAADDPLQDIRLIGFDFSATSDTIDVSNFVWLLDLPGGDALYGFQTVNLPKPAATYTAMARAEGLILDLTSEPVRVAGFDATVNGTGSLNVIGSIDGGFPSAAEVDAGFEQRVSFTLEAATLSGGLLELSINGGGGGGDTTDSDGDGVPDAIDAFPNDPTETTDTDGDGVGDVADIAPNDPTVWQDSGNGDGGGGSTGGGTVPSMCGAGAAPGMILMLLMFGGVRMRRRW